MQRSSLLYRVPSGTVVAKGGNVVPSHYRIDRCQEGFLISLVGRGTLRESPAFRDFVVKLFRGDTAGRRQSDRV